MTPTDEQLTRLAREGRHDAFGELVRRHHAKVIGLCLSLLGERTQAEDAAQEVFVKAYQGLDGFRGEARFSTWLYRVAYRHSLDLLRARARRRTESWDAMLEAEGDRIHRLLTDGLKPDPAVADDLLAALSPENRLVVTLREVQGLSYEEIAAATRSSLDSVKARLRRSRQVLREKLRHFLDPGSVQTSGSHP